LLRDTALAPGIWAAILSASSMLEDATVTWYGGRAPLPRNMEILTH